MLQKLNESIPSSNRGDVHAIYGVYASSDIIDIANRSKASLIVMALRQKYSMIDRLIGTVTAQTMDKSNIPVLAIPSGAKYNGIEEMLFPTESKQNEILESEEEALYRLYSFSLLSDNPRVNMVHISDNDKAIDIHFKNTPIEDMKYSISYSKNIDDGIMKFVGHNQIDLIVILKKHRNFWQRIYHSSVTRKLLFKSRIPLLILS